MELKTYKNEHGHDMNVVEVDAEGKRVKVDYGNGHFHWWGEDEFSKWTVTTTEHIIESKEEEKPDTGSEEIADATTTGIEHCPITEEPKLKKKAAAKKTTKKK